MSMMEATSSASSSDEDERVSMKPIQSLDDLPSDDSVSLDSTTDEEEEEGEDADNASSNDSSDDSSSVASSDNDSEDDDCEDESSGSGHDDDFEDVPLEERVRQRREVGVSQKARADARERKSRALQVASQRLKAASSSSSAPTNKKKNKHAPTEASSKRSDYFKRGAPQLNSSGVGVEIGAHRYKPRDPRISEHIDPGRVDDNYAFLQELRDNEISILKKKIALHKLPGKKGQKARRKMGLVQGSLKEDQEHLTRLLQEKASYERAQLDRRAKQAVKQKMKENVAGGKGVYYLKKREMKRLQLEAKFEELRKRGGDAAVDKALAKRRKKNKSKDTGFMPRDL
jgi:ribosomal RNA-processing protein 36